jgi:hypothetical protein
MRGKRASHYHWVSYWRLGGRVEPINRKHGLLFFHNACHVYFCLLCLVLYVLQQRRPHPAPPLSLSFLSPPPPPLPPFVHKRRLVVFLLSECLFRSFFPMQPFPLRVTSMMRVNPPVWLICKPRDSPGHSRDKQQLTSTHIIHCPHQPHAT